jgi:hypothetical protein
VATTEKVVDRAADLERYIELRAFELLVSSNCALGQVLNDHLHSFDLEDGLEIVPEDKGKGLNALWAELMPEEFEGSTGGDVVGARVDLLLARMVRSITPDVVERTAQHFESLATLLLKDVHQELEEQAVSDAG